MKIITLGLALLALAGEGRAQTPIDELFGDDAGDRFGEAVAFIGDVNGDGAADFAAGAPGDDDNGLDVLAGTREDGTIGTDAGKITPLTLGCPPDAVSSYCTAVANSTGQDGLAELDLDREQVSGRQARSVLLRHATHGAAGG